MANRPKPRALKVLQGTFREDRDLGAPEPAAVVPDPPAELGDDLRELLVHPGTGTAHVAEGSRSVCGRLERSKAGQAKGHPTCKVCITRTADREPSSVALEFWHRHAPLLAGQGLMAEDYVEALAQAAFLKEIQTKAIEAIREHGLVDTEGRKRAEVNIAKDCVQQLRLFLVEFGLTPASRPKVGAIKKPRANKFDDL